QHAVASGRLPEKDSRSGSFSPRNRRALQSFAGRRSDPRSTPVPWHELRVRARGGLFRGLHTSVQPSPSFRRSLTGYPAGHRRDDVSLSSYLSPWPLPHRPRAPDENSTSDKRGGRL